MGGLSPLRAGDTVALVSPASWPDDVAEVTERLTGWGFRVRTGAHALDRHGFLAGRDEDRLADLNAAIRGPARCARS